MTITPAELNATIVFDDKKGVARWVGYAVQDTNAFEDFLRGPVAARAGDGVAQGEFEDELRGLATTGLGKTHLEKLLSAVPKPQNWEIGEALAETLLAEDTARKVLWPWNEARDRRTPRASLPGADLVGFATDAKGFVLLFGEVKTSSQKTSPPGVMYGRHGMTWQLDRSATQLGIQHALLRWLSFRCMTAQLRPAYKDAVRRYLESEGKDMLIVGMLLRDTAPDERDIASRAKQLSGLPAPTRVEVTAWYLPVPISQWSSCAGGSP